MIDSQKLLTDLQKEVIRLHNDLRARCDAEPAVDAGLGSAYDAARAGQRTALTYKSWREEELTNVAVAWVLACVFIRFLEDNDLVETLHLAGPDAAGLGRARDQQIDFFRNHPGLTEREYLEHVFTEIGKLPGMADLFDRRHNPLWTVGPTGDAARALVEFWRKADAMSGHPVHCFSDARAGGVEKENIQRQTLNVQHSTAEDAMGASLDVERWKLNVERSPLSDPTRFLGDLYQDLSEAARKRYALLQTPVFIEQFILDRTLTPAIETFGFREVRMIDPTCGSGHFLLGGFARLFALWNEALPGEVPSVIAQHALDQVFGVDLNPNVVAIARFRLLLAALRACGTTRLRHAYDFKIHVAAGDSLLHGRRFRQNETHTTGPQRTFDTEEIFRDELKHHYEVEDVEALHRILGQQYHAVVGNPPYITVKDGAVSELYRARYLSCHRKYSLSVPFMERFFDLAVKSDGSPQQPAGFIGQITANSFMKREFGKKLIEEYLPRWDLTHVLDTSGASIPGHGTPTVIVFGKNQPPVSGTIRTVLGIRGEPATPSEPSQGLVWQAICRQIDHAGSVSEWVSAGDSQRVNFHHHPWSIGGGGAAELKELIEESCELVLGKFSRVMGVFGMTNADDIMLASPDVFRRFGVEEDAFRSLVVGDLIRNWIIMPAESVLFPYDDRKGLRPLDQLPRLHQWLWPSRTTLGNRATFGKSTYFNEGRAWWAWHQVALERLQPVLGITFGFVATHNHFAIADTAMVFKQSAPIIKLSVTANIEDHARLIGVLNSGLACFWMKQVMNGKHKGDGGEAHASVEGQRFEFDSTKLHQFPIPARQPTQLPTALVKTSTALQGQSPAATLASWAGPQSGDLRPWLARAHDLATRLRRQLIAWQEELDWQIYEAFGLVEGADGVSLPEGRGVNSNQCSVISGTQHCSLITDELPELELGQRAFEIVLARRMKGMTNDEGQMSNEGAKPEFKTTWFERHGSTPITEIPSHWPKAYRELVERRIARIESDPNIRLIEQPEYKRRWNTESWDEAFARAAKEWLLLRLETYFFGSERMVAKAGKEGENIQRSTLNVQLSKEAADAGAPSLDVKRSALSGFPSATRPAFTTTNQLAEIAKTDRAFQAVAEQLMGGVGFSVPKLVRELVESASVPFLPGQRFKPSGLLKRRDWEQVWELQRQEDAIEAEIEKLNVQLSTLDAQRTTPPDPARSAQLKSEIKNLKSEIPSIPVPPKYASSDFKKSVWWSLRGKLDVPKERWISYPGTERIEDPSPVIAWAGWDHAQQARALAEYYVDAKQTYAFPSGKLTLLLAGLLELQPWLTQWHAEPDPAFGVSPAEAIKGFIEAECQSLGVTREDLERMRMGG